jgi:putative transposase
LVTCFAYFNEGFIFVSKYYLIIMKSTIKFYLHAILIVDGQKELIRPEIKDELYDYILDSMEKKNSRVFQIGGTPNHIHILFNMIPDMSFDEFLKRIKLDAQTFVQHNHDSTFFFDDGYYVFSVGEEDIEKETLYIMQQEAYHREKSLKAELRRYREELGMETTDILTDLNENSFN